MAPRGLPALTMIALRHFSGIAGSVRERTRGGAMGRKVNANAELTPNRTRNAGPRGRARLGPLCPKCDIMSAVAAGAVPVACARTSLSLHALTPYGQPLNYPCALNQLILLNALLF
jgi:hypothetical protein